MRPARAHSSVLLSALLSMVTAKHYCDCAGEKCLCCENVHSKHIIKFNVRAPEGRQTPSHNDASFTRLVSPPGRQDTFCADVTYKPTSEMLAFEIDLNGKDVFDYSFNLGEFNRTCFTVPDTFREADICLDFSGTVLNASYVGTCPSIEIDIHHVKLAHADLGCFGFHI